MQGLADGYFVIPSTVGDYLANHADMDIKVGTDHDSFSSVEATVKERQGALKAVQGKRTVDSFHKELGLTMWNKCGMGRTKEGLEEAIASIPKLREEFWSDVRVPGGDDFNPELEKAGRVADFLEFGELMCRDALHREESCGGHFREEHRTEEGEAKRNDKDFAYAGVWEHKGEGVEPELSKELLEFEHVKLATRSYK
jgi:succinate dehydrogenase / fumarate reductase flavoprotein subunit